MCVFVEACVRVSASACLCGVCVKLFFVVSVRRGFESLVSLSLLLVVFARVG